MSVGEISAWHYSTRRPVTVRWSEGVIVSIARADPPPPRDFWIAPALFDVQVNGYGGIDFQQDASSEADLLSAARRLRRDGCAQFLLTLITADWNTLISRLRHIKAIRDGAPELRSAIAGWHIEGPFLSEQPGFHGAHDPSWMRDPSEGLLRELRVLAGNDPVLLTLAPERNGAIEAIRCAVSLGFKVSLGHTNASAEVLKEAVQAGATSFTHLGNGCPRELDRHDNILWRVFETEGLIVSVIPDRIHVSPPLFRLMHRVLGRAVCYTTDAMSAAGAPPGRYRLNEMEIEVGADQMVRQPGKTTFAGSALRPIDGVFRAAEMLDCSWQQVWARFSETPAALMGLRNQILPGAAANFCTLQMAGDRLANLSVYVAGERHPPAASE